RWRTTAPGSPPCCGAAAESAVERPLGRSRRLLVASVFGQPHPPAVDPHRDRSWAAGRQRLGADQPPEPLSLPTAGVVFGGRLQVLPPRLAVLAGGQPSGRSVGG